MQIVFNCLNSGLGNNGGSKTILKCADVINQLGHKAIVSATKDNFTWFMHDPVIPHIPYDTNAIVATACTTMISTILAPPKNKFWYIRGHEIWVPNYNDKILKEHYSNHRLIKIANSTWLQKLVQSTGQPCYVVHQGYDLSDWEYAKKYEYIRWSFTKPCIGCLYGNKPTKNWKYFIKLAEMFGNSFSYIAYGSIKDTPSFPQQLIYTYNPSREQLNDIYGKCMFWFCPSELEGLANPPIEATLCGCCLIIYNHISNGIDYYNQDNSIIFNNVKELKEILGQYINTDNKEGTRQIIKGKAANMYHTVTTKICDRKTNMIKFMDIIKKEYK